MRDRSAAPDASAFGSLLDLGAATETVGHHLASLACLPHGREQRALAALQVRLAMDEERKRAFGRARARLGAACSGHQGSATATDPQTGRATVWSRRQPKYGQRAPMVMGIAIGSIALTYLASRYGLTGFKSSVLSRY